MRRPPVPSLRLRRPIDRPECRDYRLSIIPGDEFERMTFRSFMAASSPGKWPRVRTARRCFEFSASMLFETV